MSRARLPAAATGERASASAPGGAVQRFARPVGGPAGPIVAHAKSAPQPRPPGVQMWSALSKAPWLDAGGRWESAMANGAVAKVSAKNLKLAPPHQKVESGGANPVKAKTIPWWAHLKALNLTFPKGKPGYVAMHMLNNRLGGPGVAENLAPGTHLFNGDHSREFEEVVIGHINAGKEVTRFDVVPHYHAGNGGFADAARQKMWPQTLASLDCTASVRDPNGQVTQINKPLAEVANLNTAPNWTAPGAAPSPAPAAAIPVAAPVAALPVAAPAAPAFNALAFHQQLALHQAALHQAALHQAAMQQAQQAALQQAVQNHAQLVANQLLALAQAHNVDPAAYNNPQAIAQAINAIGALNGVAPQFQMAVFQQVHALFVQYNQAQAAMAQQNAMNGAAPMVP